MDRISTDIAIMGAGMAGAGLAAAIGRRARVLLLEAERQPGYHATGRSAAFWAESYGGPLVQPLTTASGPWLRHHGFLSPRGCLHLAESPEALEAIEQTLAAGGIARERWDRPTLERRLPAVRSTMTCGLWEPSCQDIDVAAFHAHELARARKGGATLRCQAPVTRIERAGREWRLHLPDAVVDAAIIVNAAGAWAGEVARLAGAMAIPIQPYRRTLIQLQVEPAPPADLPLVMDAAGEYYFKPDVGGRIWLSPHDETPVPAHDVAPEELDQALAISRLQRVVDWRVIRRERAWAGLRSFAPDRLPVYGHDPVAPGFFWCAGQGGFGIQTAPAASALAAALLLGEPAPAGYAAVDMAAYAPGRFQRTG